jgi:hypothetical protein
MNNQVNALAVYNNTLFAGGYFNEAGGNPSCHVAAWDGSQWTGAGCCDTPGDANNDGACNIGDEVFLGNFVFRSGQCDDPPGNTIGCPPECLAEGDANADGSVNIGDEVFLGNYIFRPPPVSPYPECGPEK